MPVYRYKAITAEGAVNGFLTADTAAEGRATLRKRGLRVQRFDESGQTRASRGQWQLPTSGRGREQALNEATHNLTMLLRVGVPLGEALNVVIRQTSRSLEPVLRRIAERVNAGADFGQALAEEKHVFDPVFVGVVRVGQASGMLEPCLERIVALRRRRQQLRQRVSAAMAYPLIVCVVGEGVVLFLLTFVVPRITGLLIQTGRSIPLPTQMLLSTTDVLRGYWWLGLSAALAIWLGLVLFDRRRRFRRALGRAVFRTPILGSLMIKAGVAQASAMLETMLRSGMPLDEALEVTRRATGNPLLKDEFARMLEALRSGRPLVQRDDKSSALPPVVLHVLSVGEQTGQLEDMLAELAQRFDADVDVAARQAVSVLEPALIIVISAVVAFIVLATILPIIRMSGAL